VTSHFKIERTIELLAPLVHRGDVCVLDVTTVFSQMNGDLIRAGLENSFSGTRDRRILFPTLLAQSRYVVNIDT